MQEPNEPRDNGADIFTMIEEVVRQIRRNENLPLDFAIQDVKLIVKAIGIEGPMEDIEIIVLPPEGH